MAKIHCLKKVFRLVSVIALIICLFSFIVFSFASQIAYAATPQSYAENSNDNYTAPVFTDSDYEYVRKNLLTGEETFYNLEERMNMTANENGRANTASYNPGLPEVTMPSLYENSLIPKSIVGSDDRIRVNNTTSYPYSAVCQLSITFPSGNTFVGTAWMYWDNIAITAGHCVFDSGEGGWATSIVVRPGANGSTNPFGTANAQSLDAPVKWTNNENAGFDYGIIVLDSDIGNTTGWFGSHYGSGLKGKSITITGYPGEYYRQMWTMSGTVKRTTTNKVFYDIDTTGGQSGSPVYWYSGATYGYQAIAIHAYGVSFLTTNSGTRITSSVFEHLASYRV